MRQQKIVDVPPALRPSPTSCRKVDPKCCRLERELRNRKFRRATKLWLKAAGTKEEQK